MYKNLKSPYISISLAYALRIIVMLLYYDYALSHDCYFPQQF